TTATANGTHTLTAVARDAAGNIATSGAVTVIVSNIAPPPPNGRPPTISYAAPGADATVSGPIVVSASASDNVGVAGVQFKLDGPHLPVEAPFPYTTLFRSTTATANGTHTLTAVARDAAGNIATSGAVTVIV